MDKHIVKMTSDAVGYYVVEIVAGMEMYIKGTSHSKQEMINLANKLNNADKAIKDQDAITRS